MLKMFGFGGAACPRCAHKNAGEDGYCAGCGLMLGAPRHAPVLVDNRWMPGPDELAVFFGVRDLAGLFVKVLRVPATARAFILQGGEATEVQQGEYEIEGFFTRLNHLLRDQHAEILVTRSGALPVEFAFDDLASSEHLQLAARVTLSLRIENVPAFARHFMTMPGTIGAAQLRELLQAPLRQLAAEFSAARSLRDMAGNAELRPQLDQHLQGGLALLLAQYGLAVARVDTLALRHDKFDANRARIGSLWLAADEQRVAREHARHLDELYGEEEWQRIRRAEQDVRLDYRRAQLRQESALERAELSLENAERAHAVRAREIELYGRIVESRTRKQAIERGAVDVVREIEHELGEKRGARLDEQGQWEHLRAVAGIRMRTELEVAQQDTLEARTVARQRFSHALVQQQIRNKIEQAQAIEDAAQRRSELARLREAEQAGALQARAIDDEEHAARLKLLQLAHRARAREAERVLEWEETQFGARLREAARGESVEAEFTRQKLDELRRAGGRADAVAQRDKLLLTIELDAEQARREQALQLDAEEKRAALRAAEREAAWQQELRVLAQQAGRQEAAHAQALELARLELARAEALGAMDDGARVALAPAANAALLADVMKARVHAGMSAEQLGGLAGVAAAALPGAEALEAARQKADAARADERGQRARDADSERRHQLDLLALHNGAGRPVAAAGVPAAGAPAAVSPAAGSSAAVSPAPAAPACTHAQAGPADRFCAACGASLAARG
ncbi:hypothetical protein HH212_23875 [Massilia forsythiae]|uniref:Band 7 domain-containing protein n=1 Tax=Massilia forsythiae TaxID=2728020 RepID=A0A7Z2W050_9BURK|nr:hypothetical protein [Massilia forsythiae]QJE02678.1 hypothetical protein HH212_23875 [Massilia forsythiae]